MTVRIYEPQDPEASQLRWADIPAWPLETSDPQPDRCLAIVEDGQTQARASMWWSSTATYREEPSVYVGHLAARRPADLARLLEAAADTAPTPGWLLGPLDGSTWHRYRVALDPENAPPFPMEPFNPAWWRDAFETAGFEPVERYWSARRDLGRDAMETPTGGLDGTRLRALQLDRFEEELDAIYDLAVEAFAANPLYTPITPDGFRRMYTPLADLIDPELCLIAEADEKPVGVMFSLPANEQDLVLKTLAVSDAYRGRGLGTRLLREAAWRGGQRSFSSLIFALMHEDNRSSAIVRQLGVSFRRYALYGRRIVR